MTVIDPMFLLQSYPGRIWKLPAGGGSADITWLDGNPAPTDIDTKLPAWTLAQQARTTYLQAIDGALTVTSTSTPSINGTYGVQPSDEFNVVALETSLAANQGFPGGAATYGYPDVTGIRHALTPTQFTALASAIRDYVSACDIAMQNAASGQTPTWPSSSVTIA
ncbi:hypothetical protein [Trinickia mobilis]|uniref:hypothetical protein n=1 Tax=Trinickia mobilis TaxID=2816356 RepID=UPI001A8E8D3C|nr:hypothetical protein [Trinickia mobilis]